MTKLFERKGKMVIADRRNPHDFDGICELCEAKAELRPYGPKGENVCFTCGMKDEAAATRQFMKHIGEAK